MNWYDCRTAGPVGLELLEANSLIASQQFPACENAGATTRQRRGACRSGERVQVHVCPAGQGDRFRNQALPSPGVRRRLQHRNLRFGKFKFTWWFSHPCDGETDSRQLAIFLASKTMVPAGVAAVAEVSQGLARPIETDPVRRGWSGPKRSIVSRRAHQIRPGLVSSVGTCFGLWLGLDSVLSV